MAAKEKRVSDIKAGSISKKPKDPFSGDFLGGMVNDLFKSISPDADEDVRVSAAKKTAALLIDVASQTAATLQAIAANEYKHEVDLLNKKGASIKQKSDDERNAVAASAAYADQKASQIAEINAREQAAQSELSRQKHELDVKNFNSTQSAARAAVVAKMAEAIANTLPLYANPATIPFAIAQDILIAGLGVAQLAQINSAQPPAYKHGIESTPRSEFAFVGDGGERELIKYPDGRHEWSSDKAELKFLPEGTSVTPISKIVKQAQNSVASTSRNDKIRAEYEFMKVIAQAIEDSSEKQTKKLLNGMYANKTNIVIPGQYTQRDINLLTKR
jgi:hypothetical protein